MKRLLTISRKCLVMLQESFQCPTNYGSSSQHLSFSRHHHHLAYRQGLDAQTHIQMVIYDDNVGFESIPIVSPSAYQADTLQKPPTSLQHPQPIPQSQSPCRWTLQGSFPLNMLAASRQDSASTARPRPLHRNLPSPTSTSSGEYPSI